MAGNVVTDTISENTAAAGVTADGVLCKDSKVTASGGADLGATPGLIVDIISEKTSATGVTIDGVLCKDSAVTALQKHTAEAADGAITISAGTVIFTKAGVNAMTLAAPSAGQAGTRMTFVAGTANAHTITATGLIDDGVTGGSKNVATFAAFVGASIVLEAYNSKWVVVGAGNNVTVS